MHKLSRVVALLLILCLAILGPCLLIKPVIAQNAANPSISILYPTNETFFNVSIEGVYFQLLYQTNDTLSWVGYSINGGANVTCTGNVTDNSAYIKDEYQFDFGHPTLTLYANDTAGNWSIPQTVTYTVYFYPDTTSPPSSPSSVSSSASPSLTTSPVYPATTALTPALPELSGLVILPLFLSTLFIAAALRHRKTASSNQ